LHPSTWQRGDCVLGYDALDLFVVAVQEVETIDEDDDLAVLVVQMSSKYIRLPSFKPITGSPELAEAPRDGIFSVLSTLVKSFLMITPGKPSAVL
jgi:hypothetical protein